MVRTALCLLLLALSSFALQLGSLDHPYNQLGLASYDFPMEVQFENADIESPILKIGIQQYDQDIALDDIVFVEGSDIVLQMSKASAAGSLKVNLVFIIAACVFGTFCRSIKHKGISIALFALVSFAYAEMYDTNSPYYTVTVQFPTGWVFERVSVEGSGTFDVDGAVGLAIEQFEIDFCQDARSQVRAKNLLVQNQLNICAAFITYEVMNSNTLDGQLDSPFDAGSVTLTLPSTFQGKVDATFSNLDVSNERCESRSPTSSEYEAICGNAASTLDVSANSVDLIIEGNPDAPSRSSTPTRLPNSSRSAEASRSSTRSRNADPSATSTRTLTSTSTAARSNLATDSSTSTRSLTSTSTGTSTRTATATGTATSTATSTATLSRGATPSNTASRPPAPSASSTNTRPPVPSASSTNTRSAAASASSTNTRSPVPSASSTTTRSVGTTASTTNTRSAAASASSTTTRSAAASASSSPLPNQCNPDGPAVDVVPNTSPVTSSWTNPGANFNLSDGAKWNSSWWDNTYDFAIGNNGTNTVFFRDEIWSLRSTWFYSRDNVFPKLSRNTQYTLSFGLWQDAINTFGGSGITPATGRFNISLIVANNVDESLVWQWLDRARNGSDCSGGGWGQCYIMYSGTVIQNQIVPTSSATALSVSKTFTVPVSDTAQLLLYITFPEQSSRATGNYYYFNNLSLVRSDQARSFGSPLTVSSTYVNVPVQPALPTPTQTNCPHKRTGLLNWHSPSTWPGGVVPAANGSPITLPENSAILISSCSVSPTGTYGTITIPQTSELIFNDATINMKVQNIYVQGHLWIGSETCRLYSYITITLVDGAVLAEPSGKKGITTSPTGIIDIHGKLYQATWTRLAASAEINDDRIIVMDNVNWEVGQRVVILTSVWKDHENPQNEVRTIAAIEGKKIQFTQPLNFFHYAGSEYQAEVGLLSRRILIQGDEASETSKVGGHIQARGPFARFSGVQAYRMGQTNVLAKYPFHFHMMGESPTSYFRDCSVEHSFYRCFTVHGTNSTTISRNVAYDVMGHCYYLEDGVEEKNVFEYNFAAYPKPIKTFNFDATGGSQSGITIYQSADLLIPADAAPGGFYISNANNDFIGNIGSGGFSAFSFINFPLPIGNHRTSTLIPQERPLRTFYGNTAHSSGYYWNQAACVYTGGTQQYQADNTLFYNVGRVERNTKDDSGAPAWMIFNHTRVYMCNRGLNHWGKRAEAINYAAHDVTKGLTLFGEAWVDNAVIEGRSGNPLLTNFPQQRGFEYYDTFVKTILTNLTFKNFAKSPTTPFRDTSNGTYAIVSMTHSDKFKPQGINAAKNIRFVNVWDGGEIGNNIRTTGASRYYNIIDWDGSILDFPFGNNVPVVIGSANDEPYITGDNSSLRIKEWWNIHSSCILKPEYDVYACRKQSNQEIANIQLDIDELTNNVDIWPDAWPEIAVGTAGINVGTVSQFGYTGADRRATIVSKNPGVTGITGDNGWYFNLDGGSPNIFYIRAMQLPTTTIPTGRTYIIVSLRYPVAATFDIRAMHLYKPELNNTLLTSGTFEQMYSNADGLVYNERNSGDGYKWLFMKILDRHFYNSADLTAGNYARGGVKLYDVMVFYWYKITVTCSGCTGTTRSGVTYYPVTDVVPPSVATLRTG